MYSFGHRYSGRVFQHPSDSCTRRSSPEHVRVDLDALGQYDKGDYAYWLGSGISTEYDQEMVENCIKLFCKENLSEQ